MEDIPERLKWWIEARFGMFIHWGIYSIPARGEWVMYQEHIPFEEYSKLADRFDPRDYRPEEWVEVARDAGMKYMVLTTRHHDGFCLFDSEVSDYTAPKTGAGRDLIAEFVDACREVDMRIGFYYSLVDWHFTGVLPHSRRQGDSVYRPMVEQAHDQVEELLTNYGKIDILWFDGMFPGDTELWRSKELVDRARGLQPEIVMNNRAGLPADYGTPENVIRREDRPWESCYTMNRTWGYARHDYNYKPTAEILHLLTSCVSQNGNLLLNVDPDEDGRFPPLAVDRLRKVGRWMDANGEAIYGAGPSPIGAPAVAVATKRGKRVYFLIHRWPGSTLNFAWCGSRPVRARILGRDADLEVDQNGDRCRVEGLPEYPPDPYMPVVEVEFDEEPAPSDPPYR
jgi:alpha-L-fucosidase